MSKLTRIDSTLDDVHAVCTFDALKYPNVVDTFHLRGKSTTKIIVFIKKALILLTQSNSTMTLSVNELVVHAKGRQDVILHPKSQPLTRLSFSSQSDAAQFIASIELIQHIHFIRLNNQCTIASLEIHIKNTTKYAEELWNCLLWKVSYSNFDFVDVLEIAQQEVCAPHPNCSAIQNILSCLYLKHSQDLSIDTAIELEGVTYYTMSHVAVLLANIKALLCHLSHLVPV